jgi:hypothetical protein
LPEPVQAKERASLTHLLTMMDKYTPHLRPSFVCSKIWWEQHLGTAQAHVRSTTAYLLTSSMLTPLQMFLYLLYGAMEHVLIIFNDAVAMPVEQIERLLNEANAKARPLWRNETTPFLTRQTQCKELLDPVVGLNLRAIGVCQRVPESITDELDRIFRKYYGSSNNPQSRGSAENLLLIGRTDDQAYQVQDEYARDIANILGTVDKTHESRAITQLRSVYGRGSLPLLCLSSVAGMWTLCQSSFYKRQTSLVSQSRPMRRSPC